ncbi:uncharacterized protein LOC134254998 [Saccostrea cucullata]|uniref:uncharacterized protein LOC134254998 n=1 Tax=Saccostrea cuccullata TaxID=36930 RepID=UPI002ED0C49A
MKPFSDSKFLDMRKRQQEAAAAKNSFRDLMISLILAGSVVAIGFTEFDVNAYYLQNNIRNYLVSDGYGQFGFSAVNDSDGFYKWMNDTFIPACYPLQTYNEVNLDILGKQMFGDLASIRVGPARVRQVRMPKRMCIPSIFIILVLLS